MMFSYSDYLDFLTMAVENKNVIFLRHDVDISLKKAVEMAEIESKNNINSTYYILLTSPFYNALSAENLERIRMIKELGHGIGLHYDMSVKDRMDHESIKNEIIVQLGLLIHHIGHTDDMSVTFHKPVMGKDVPIEVINLLNKEGVYSPNFDQQYKYISDSGHNWREDPIETIMGYNKVHINVHPEWYNKEDLSMEECLLNLRLDVEMDKIILKEVKHIRNYLLQLSGK